MSNWSDPANVVAVVAAVVQFVLVVLVWWYTAETQALVKAAREQIAVSNREVETGLMQVEALQTPFLIIPDAARRPDDAARQAEGIVGDRIISEDAAYLGIQNIGAHALDIDITVTEEQGQATVHPVHRRRISFLPASVKVHTSYSISAMKGRSCDIEICYSSLSGQRYESRFAVRKLVILKSSFRRLPTIPQSSS